MAEREKKTFACEISIRGGGSTFIGRGEDDTDRRTALDAAYADALGALERVEKEAAAEEAKRQAGVT